MPGDQVEVRGPIGGYFVWEAALGGPLLLVAGGSGIVPLMAMIRHRAAAGSHVATRLLYSVRSPEEAIYYDELERRRAQGDGLEVFYTFTRSRTARLAGIRAAHRPPDARRGRRAARARSAGLRLRPDSPGRKRGQRPGRNRHPAGSHPHRAVRAHGRTRAEEANPMDEVDAIWTGCSCSTRTPQPGSFTILCPGDDRQPNPMRLLRPRRESWGRCSLSCRRPASCSVVRPAKTSCCASSARRRPSTWMPGAPRTLSSAAHNTTAHSCSAARRPVE